MAQQPPNTVIEVRVEGNDRLSRNAVLSYVKTRVGMAYDDQIVKADRDRMTASGRFSRVTATRKYTPKGVIVTFKVVERPTVTQVELVGLKKYKEEELRKDLPISEGDPLNQATIEAGKQVIINKYHSDGFHFIKVTVDEEALNKKHVVLYRIVEGPRTIIKKVSFEGNHYFSNFSLKLRISTRAKFWPFIPGVLNFEKIERDVTLIRNIYVADGFLDAEVGRDPDFSDDKKTVRITFLIKEGPRYRINKVQFEGNTVFSGQELERRLKFKQGSFYTSEVLRLDIKKVESAFGELGYIDVEVHPEKRFWSPERHPPPWAQHLDGGKPALLDLIFRIVEHDQYRIGTIRIQGNSITQERVIRREFRFYPEQLYDTVAVEYSKVRLQGLRLFDEVTITPIGTRKKDVKDILVEIKEADTGKFMIGVGVDSNSGAFATVSFTQQNFDILAWPKSFKQFIKAESFKGAGQTFNITAEPGIEFMRFSVGWFTPYIFDQPYSVGLKVYLFERDYDGYEELRLGVQGSIGHLFKNRWYGELATRMENIQIDAYNNSAVEIQKDEGHHILVGLRGSLVRDRTNSRWMPSDGDRFRFSYEQVVGTDVFGKFGADYRIYRTVYVDALDRKHILAGRTSFGQIVGDAPVFEKFYGGGLGSVRGFRYRGISPRGHWPGGAKHDDPIGGDMMLFVGGEYTFPIIAEQLRGLVFLDTGTVEKDFGISTYRASVGFGVRWTIPFFGQVPMSFDFGFPIVKDEDDDEQIFSFYLGWTF